MTDRERILSAVIRELASTQLLAPRGSALLGEESFADGQGGHHVHLAYYRKPEPGDLVLCKTSGLWVPHPWLIAWYVEHEPRGYGTATLREIGSERLCNMSNESFVAIVGMNPLDTLEGLQHQIYRKVLSAFSRGGEYIYRFGGLDFPEARLARVWIREVFGGLDSVPFSVDIPFNGKTGVSTILAAMRAGGYGTRQFERRPAPVNA